MFPFPGCRARGLWIDPSSTGISASGLPHSEIHGSKRVGRSPWLIAASRVLRRLAMPRHPPHARQRLRGQSRPRTRLQTRGAPRARRSLRHSSGLWKNRFACQRSKRGGIEGHCRGGLVGVTGVGPVTSSLSGTRSNQLSYTPGIGGGNRDRTGDFRLAKPALCQLSYAPVGSGCARPGAGGARSRVHAVRRTPKLQGG